jgi:hypothetical protein
MREAAQICAVVFGTLAWVIILYGGVIRFKSRLISPKMPLRLAYISFYWTVLVVAGFVAWNRFQQSESTNALGSKSWFNVGYKFGLTIFSIPIDTWWKYFFVVQYQITRSVMGSLLANVFRPFMLAEVQSKMHNGGIDRRETIPILFAQASVTIFGFVATITDLFLYLSQVDISVISLVITLISDATATRAVLEAGFRNDATKIAQRNTEGLGLQKTSTSDQVVFNVWNSAK